jgi:subtilisin family serine protease
VLKVTARSALVSTTFCLVLALATRGSTAETSVVPSALMQAAQAQRSVRVIVQLGSALAVPESFFADAASRMAHRLNIARGQSAVRTALAGTRHRIVREYSSIPYLAISASPGALRALDAMRGVVVGVHEDVLLEPSLQQSVPLIRADQAALGGFDGTGTVIAILDTGVFTEHPFFRGRVVHEACFAYGATADDGDGDCPGRVESAVGPGAARPCRFASDVAGFFTPCDHGTHVAGIAAGGYDRNGRLFRTGVAPNAEIMAVQVFSNSRDNANRPIAHTSDIIAGLEHVLALSQGGDGSFNVAAVNMSLASRKAFSDTVDCDVADGGATKLAIDNLRAAGIATVIAAGNDAHTRQIAFPACISSAIPVAATGDGGPERPSPVLNRVSTFSNVASTVSFPSLLAAPGQWITSSVPNWDGISNYLRTIDGDGYATIAGTSMAAPHVAGTFAILKQMVPEATVEALLHRLKSTGVVISDARAGAVGSAALPRRIDALAALQSLGPDLTVTAARVLTMGGVPPGGNVSVTFTLKNLGGLPATSFPVKFSLVFFQEVPIGPTMIVDLLPNGASRTFTVPLTVPLTTRVGVYSVRVMADPDNLLNQANTRNNILYTDYTVFVGLPDLTVPTVTFTTPVATPGAVAAGGSIGVGHTLRNTPSYETPANATPSLSGLYIGTNRSFASVIGPAIATITMAGVRENTTSPLTTKPNVTIPASLAPGRYYLFARANDNGAFLETDTSNNVGVSATSLVVGPDLVVTSASVAAGVAPGTNVSVSYTLANRGGQPAGPFTTGFALVPVDTTGTPTGREIPLGPSSSAVTLAGGASHPYVSAVGIPATTEPGTYRIRVTTDDGNVVVEADENNNSLLTGIVNVIRPDLTVTSVTFRPAAVAPGGNASITHIVRNLSPAPGSAPASVSSLGMTGPGGATTELARVAVPPIAALGTTTVTRSVQLPANTAPGLYAISAFADAPEGVLEAGEQNNASTAAARLIVGPDLLISTATTVRSALPGSSIPVNFTVRNQGAGAAGPFSAGFALVPVNAGGAPTGNDVPLGPARTGLAVVGGTSQALVSNVAIPVDTLSGRYRIRVIADVANDVAEASEDNNTLLTTGILSLADPDLTVPSVTVAPLVVAPGGNVSVTHVVKNIAPPPSNAPPTTSAIYLASAHCDPGANACGPSLASAAVPGVAAGSSATIKTTMTIDPLMAPGKYFVVAWARDDGFIDQQPSNNVGTSLTMLTVGPDIVVTAASTVATVGLDASVSVRYTLQNKGGAAANAFAVGFALVPVDSTGAPLGPEIPVGPAHAPIDLTAGAAAALSSTVLIDASSGITPGPYRLRVIADPGNVVAEADELNNTLLTAVLQVVAADRW